MEHTFAICAYKESEYLQECIESLLEQTEKSHIFIATHTDNAFLRQMAERYDLPVFVNEGESGITQDWNFALSKVTTPYATIAHQDDVYEPTYTQEVMKRMRAARHPLLCFTDYFEIRNGALFDKAGLRNTMLVSSAVTLAAAAGLAFSYAGAGSATYIVSALLVGAGYGAIPVIASGFVRERFGGKNYARNLGLVNLSAALASFFGMAVVALSSPDGTSTNMPVWIAISIVAALALACAIAFKFVYRKPSE